LKRLIKVPTWVWALLTCIISISAITLFFVLTMNIETSRKYIVKVDGDSISLLIPSDGIYDIKTGQEINLRIQNTIYHATIKEVATPEEGVFKVTLNGLGRELFKGSSLHATIILDNQKVYEHLLLYN